ncbi:hypothetical protein BDV93DRAFT_513493 [Ceratobasidium sp. AG-I]|nr:hypothetical protein BDV93DRAFT_513493 [Ceratobasidium sp. AG-I]
MFGFSPTLELEFRSQELKSRQQKQIVNIEKEDILNQEHAGPRQGVKSKSLTHEIRILQQHVVCSFWITERERAVVAGVQAERLALSTESPNERLKFRYTGVFEAQVPTEFEHSEISKNYLVSDTSSKDVVETTIVVRQRLGGDIGEENLRVALGKALAYLSDGLGNEIVEREVVLHQISRKSDLTGVKVTRWNQKILGVRVPLGSPHDRPSIQLGGQMDWKQQKEKVNTGRAKGVRVVLKLLEHSKGHLINSFGYACGFHKSKPEKGIGEPSQTGNGIVEATSTGERKEAAGSKARLHLGGPP